jgi:large subunit ribosomal protein L4
MVTEDFNMESPKTKQYVDIMKSLSLADKKTLVVISEDNKSLYLSSRNLPKNKVITAAELNTYDILNATNLLLTESSLPIIENNLLK